jgi:ELWxxDGT repeat protein
VFSIRKRGEIIMKKLFIPIVFVISLLILFGCSGDGGITDLIISYFYFPGIDETHGYELWKSDGTEAGTMLLKDINSSGDSWCWDFTYVNGKVFFSADDGTHGTEVWVSDGTEAGTKMVKDIHPGSGSSGPYNLTNVNGLLYFVAGDGTNGYELWKSDGTEAGTQMVKNIHSTGTRARTTLPA